MLQYYGITQKQLKALTETLKINTHVQNIILQDNWLTEEQMLMLCNTIEENTVLRVLNLKECRIGQKGFPLFFCIHSILNFHVP